MRLVCVSREGRDYSRAVEEWIVEFTRRTGREVEIIDPDTREGVSFCEAYGVMEQPTIMVLEEDGQVRGLWKGTSLPLFDEVIAAVVA